jgi:HAD superfamily phosphoserine phosphatase-like hydrolase
VQCLDRQIAGLRAYKAELIDFVADCQIDPYFAPIVQWAASARVDLFVVSDNFSCLVREILSRHGLSDVPVMANELTFSGNRPEAHFPFRSPACERCAHCKALHFGRFERNRKIYVGDGLSDICPGLAANLVFAKGSLADYLSRRGVSFRDFVSLETVADFLLADGRKVHRASVQARTQTLAEHLSTDFALRGD